MQIKGDDEEDEGNEDGFEDLEDEDEDIKAIVGKAKGNANNKDKKNETKK